MLKCVLITYHMRRLCISAWSKFVHVCVYVGGGIVEVPGKVYQHTHTHCTLVYRTESPYGPPSTQQLCSMQRRSVLVALHTTLYHTLKSERKKVIMIYSRFKIMSDRSPALFAFKLLGDLWLTVQIYPINLN